MRNKELFQKDHKWNILNLLFEKLMRDNMQNKDLLERFQFLDLPNDFRQKIWSLCLVNLTQNFPKTGAFRQTNLLQTNTGKNIMIID